MVLKDVVNAIDGEWAATFHTVEREVPSLTAIQTTTDPVVAIELHFQGCVIGMLHKSTVLKKFTLKPMLNNGLVDFILPRSKKTLHSAIEFKISEIPKQCLIPKPFFAEFPLASACLASFAKVFERQF